MCTYVLLHVQVGGQGFFQDLPHLLVWGGEGTRMDADIHEALTRWTPALRQSRQKAQRQQQKQQQQQQQQQEEKQQEG
jgi:hypothetical protein